MTRLFGTDGIRGKALEPPLDQDTVQRLGAALAERLGMRHERPHLLLAGDTRASTECLARWLGGAFRNRGGDVTWAAVLPTPAVSQLLRGGTYHAGVVISASHNPAEDNGIKILSPTGEKLEDATERLLEELIEAADPGATDSLPAADPSLAARYLELVAASHQARQPLAGLHLVVDAANGAASALARPLLEGLGARLTMIFDDPDGLNINAGCGATAPDALARTVVESGADAGLALDGDADRALLVDERGAVLDGDDILLAWARHLDAQGQLPGRKVVATVMSNLGLEKALARDGIETVRCPVGDRSVWLAMTEHRAALGGEQSGHIICSHHSVSGDGLLTGSHLLAIAAGRRRRLSELSDLRRLPQVLINVPVARRRPFSELPLLSRALDETERRLDSRGRVLLRYSGTEPLVRVMLEGEDQDEIRGLAESLAETVAEELR
jgi:phosphoglucosamine mutase